MGAYRSGQNPLNSPAHSLTHSLTLFHSLGVGKRTGQPKSEISTPNPQLSHTLSLTHSLTLSYSLGLGKRTAAAEMSVMVARAAMPWCRQIVDLLPNSQRQHRTCYVLCHRMFSVSAAHTSIFRMDSILMHWFSRSGQFTRIGHVSGAGRPLLREGGPISYEARPSAFFQTERRRQYCRDS